MAVVLETSLGDIVIDLHTEEAPNACLNFLKLCTVKYYNNCLFHSVQKDFIAQTGDPSGTGKGGQCIWNVIDSKKSRFFSSEIHPKLSHNKIGVVSMACLDGDKDKLGSQFFITLTDDLQRLDKHFTIIGEVGEGFDVLSKINEAFVDKEDRPMRNIRIRHTIIIEDPFEHVCVDGLTGVIPESSPQPTLDQYDYERIRDDEEILEPGQNDQDLHEELEFVKNRTNAQILVMIDDIPDVETKPPENVLFVCRLNPITEDEDLRIIFQRFGRIQSCEVIKDWKTGDSLQYAFIEYERVEDGEKAYVEMENVLIDDRRIHVDFSQSVAKFYWHHKKKGKFNQQKGANHARVEEANKMWNKRHEGHAQSQSYRKDKVADIQFECVDDGQSAVHKQRRLNEHKSHQKSDSKYDDQDRARHRSKHRHRHHSTDHKHKDKKYSNSDSLSHKDRKSHRRHKHDRSRSRSRDRRRHSNKSRNNY
mmetsp:Transcript_29858/g.48626  ORF Transcript_29858/g.48626 Transcript_29858/m.48626 type:complete len:476 (-) Transcript_29858:678-2105(-)